MVHFSIIIIFIFLFYYFFFQVFIFNNFFFSLIFIYFNNKNNKTDIVDNYNEFPPLGHESGGGAIGGGAHYRYDLILFPRVLELCLVYMVEFMKQHASTADANCADATPPKEHYTQSVKHTMLRISKFLKRLLYLLESCNLNVQIIINNVSIVRERERV
jgi:hypothetical protein